MKANGIAPYQAAMFSTPVVSWNRAAAMSSSTEPRSSAWPRSRAGGQVNSFG